MPPLLLLLALGPAAGDYARDVRPLLASHCVRCHGPKRQEGGLRLDVRSRARQGGDSGPALAKGGTLLPRVTSRDEARRMPPDGPLSPEQVATLKAWIDGGAPWPDDLAGKEPAADHWAFRPVARPTPPAVRAAAWTRGPIDTFVLARLEAEKLAPSPEADRRTLARRLHLDLVGLPPTPEQSDAFADDVSPDAYERLVDRLLASPHFGERWGRHWLDLARYAESDGYENDNLRHDAWRWRDWVVRSLNADQPYDAFTAEQLAGDLLPDATTEQHAGTGLHRNTLYNSAASADKKEFRTYAVKDRAETTASAWLGLTFGCASCHSHKYDPVSLREYYSFYAFFDATDEVDIPARDGKTKGRYPALKAAPRKTHVFERGSYLRPGVEVEAGTPAFLPPLRPRGAKADRLDLARWLTRDGHPLTARVAADRAWRHLFGAGLVPTPDNFGTSGEPPSHPELLDHLAREFVRAGWGRKASVRAVVLSSAYRQVSTHRPELKARDPDNRLLARQNRFRVEAELVHDLALSSAGLLRQEMGGPSFVPPFPRELPVGQFTAESLKQPTKERHRRAIYVHVQRTLTHPLLGAFDVPDGNQPCLRRARSATAVQALALLNDPTFLEASRELGRRLAAEPEPRRLALAFRRTLGREPTAAEAGVMADLLRASRQREPAEAVVWAGVARVLMNAEEFTARE